MLSAGFRPTGQSPRPLFCHLADKVPRRSCCNLDPVPCQLICSILHLGFVRVVSFLQGLRFSAQTSSGGVTASRLPTPARTQLKCTNHRTSLHLVGSHPQFFGRSLLRRLELGINCPWWGRASPSLHSVYQTSSISAGAMSRSARTSRTRARPRRPPPGASSRFRRSVPTHDGPASARARQAHRNRDKHWSWREG